MGIRVITKTKAKATSKLANNFRSYLFEQELGELKGISETDLNKLKSALKVLDKIITNNI